MAKSIPPAPTVIRAELFVCTLKVLPDFAIPLPLVISPAPENCTNDKEVEPRVIGAAVANTHPVAA